MVVKIHQKICIITDRFVSLKNLTKTLFCNGEDRVLDITFLRTFLLVS